MHSTPSFVHEIGKNHASAADKVCPTAQPVVILTLATTDRLVVPITSDFMKTIAMANANNAIDTEPEEQWITGRGLFSGSAWNGSKL